MFRVLTWPRRGGASAQWRGDPSLVSGAVPAFKEFGFGFLWSEAWNPVTEKFGALAPVYGTLVTSLIAMAIAVPIGSRHRDVSDRTLSHSAAPAVGIAIELLAGIPTIIYGHWGLFVFAPVLQDTCSRVSSGHSQVFRFCLCCFWPAYGIGMLTSGVILAIMVLPFVTSISRDVFEAVPPVLKEAAYGLGCTTWEVVRYVVLPYTRVGVIGGVMLGLGRALGETMAVTFVIGNAHKILGFAAGAGHDHFGDHRQ